MRISYIYLVIGKHKDESFPIRAFEREEHAMAFTKRCNQYEKTRPPETGKEEEWHKVHPAGKLGWESHRYEYKPVEMELVD